LNALPPPPSRRRSPLLALSRGAGRRGAGPPCRVHRLTPPPQTAHPRACQIHGVLPEELPASMGANLRQLLAEADSPGGPSAAAAVMLQGAARPGCVQLEVDVLLAVAGGGDAAAAAALRARLPGAALAALAGAGAGGAACLLRAQIDDAAVADAGAAGGAPEWRAPADAACAAPRLLAALPCAVLSRRARSRTAPAAAPLPELLVTATGVAAGGGGGRPAGRDFLFLRSRGAFHRPPPPRAARGGGPAGCELPPEQHFRVALPPGAAARPGLLLVEAEAEAESEAPHRRNAGGAAVAPGGRLLSNQLPVVVTGDARVVWELRELEGRLAGHIQPAPPVADAHGGPCRCALARPHAREGWVRVCGTALASPSAAPALRPLTPAHLLHRLLAAADARQVVVDVGMLLEAEEVERDEGLHPLQGCGLFRRAIRCGGGGGATRG
jgi:hypothetical protein